MARTGLEPLEMRCGDAGAITPTHQHAVLGVAQIRDAHREPYADCGQGDGKGERCHVRQHPLAKIVRLTPWLFVTGQITWLFLRVANGTLLAWICAVRRPRPGARAEFKHAVLLLGRDWLLAIHCFQLRYTFILACQLMRLRKICAMSGRDLSLQSRMEPAVVYSKSALFGCVEDIGITLAEAN